MSTNKPASDTRESSFVGLTALGGTSSTYLVCRTQNHECRRCSPGEKYDPVLSLSLGDRMARETGTLSAVGLGAGLVRCSRLRVPSCACDYTMSLYTRTEMRTPSMADVVLLVETSALAHDAMLASMRARSQVENCCTRVSRTDERFLSSAESRLVWTMVS